MKLRWPPKKTWFILAGAASLFAWIYGPGFAKIRDLKKQESSIEQKIEQLEVSNRQLSQKIEQLENDPLAVEREVRRKLGLTRSKEVTYKIINEKELRRNRIE